MQYIITFLEGIITFISPCVLPMIPVYVLYFAGGAQDKKYRAILNSVAFVAGFTVLFLLLGIFSGTLGTVLTRYNTAVNIATGAVVTIFGLNYTGVIKIGFLNKTIKPDAKLKPETVLRSALFGAVFAVGWSPCTGAFLGSAMMIAAEQGGKIQGMLLLLCYSLGLGIPFILCAALLDRLKTAIGFIKKNYRTVNIICGIFLIIIGILMMTGLFSRITAALS